MTSRFDGIVIARRCSFGFADVAERRFRWHHRAF
jgi:hypothetical protein